jgi:GAF domain-containing protein
MIRRRIGIFGVSEESLRLIPLMVANPEVEIARVWDADRAAALARARAIDPALAQSLEPLLTDDLEGFAAEGDLHSVVDAGVGASFQARVPGAADRGMQIVSPLTARLLWGYGVAARDRKAELLQALGEVVESVDLTIHSEELFRRMLEIAVGITGADGGSLMFLDPKRRELRISVALGVEPELWPKIRVPLGEGIAGRAAADGRSIVLRGKADHQAFQIVRERIDVESALCAPLIHEGRVMGVLNLHHSTRTEAFSAGDLEFVEQLAGLDAQIIARAQEHQALRNQAARYTAVREVRGILAGPDPLPERLRSICQFVAGRLGRGIANVYLHDSDEDELLLAATSLEGGGFGGEYRVVPGQGIDGQVAHTGSPAFLRREDGALAYVALPLLAGDRLMGVLSIQAGSDPPRGRAIEEALHEIAAAVADGVAQAERETRMSARATRVSAINETGIRMISATELTDVVRLATSSVAMILDADHAVLRLRDDETRRYVIRSYYGPADGREQERLFRLDKQVSVETIRRRTTQLIRDLETHSTLSSLRGELRSLLSAPLKREGQVVGTISIYDKVATDRFYSGRFNDDDLQIFTRFVSYVERAVANSLFHAGLRRHRNFDEETGLPNAAYLSKRIHEEITRSLGREGALAVAVCQIENLEEVARHANPAQAHRVVLRTVDALRAHLRDFDVLGRSSDSTFTVLMPEPGLSPGERVFGLARAVADAISKDDSLNDPVRIALSFGYAVHPSDGPDRESLLARAGVPRIRMV